MQIADDLAAFVGVLDAEGHVVAGDEFFRIRQPAVQSIGTPDDSGVLERIRVREGKDGAGTASVDASQVRSLHLAVG